MLGAVPLVHAANQLLANLPREVEIDIGYRCEALVEETADEELVGDGIDVGETRKVADD